VLVGLRASIPKTPGAFVDMCLTYKLYCFVKSDPALVSRMPDNSRCVGVMQAVRSTVPQCKLVPRLGRCCTGLQQLRLYRIYMQKGVMVGGVAGSPGVTPRGRE
jgi:hypothetical protein